MTDKEFKRLTRAQLIDIIYQLQLQVDDLTEQNQKLEAALEDKHIRINSAGNIAAAALEISDCFRSAQNAAELYLSEIEKLRDTTEAERTRIISEAQHEAAQLVENAKVEAAQLISSAQKDAEDIIDCATRSKSEYETAIEAVLNEYRESGS